MRTLAAFILSLCLLMTLTAIAAEEPDTIVFEAKMGNVTFDHKAHNEAAGDDCTVCHDALFPESRAPINFKDKMHRTAEANKTSCGGCHHDGGKSFATKGNCKRCHVK